MARPPRPSSRSLRRLALLGAGAALLYLGQWLTGSDLGLGGGGPGATPPVAARDDTARIEELFRDERSGVMVEAEGVVERVLRDDREGSQHQRFILAIGDRGQTLLVSHNIDLAPRLPVRAGDRVRFRGQYEWNERGGVVHWTHHDPRGRREGGWLDHEGRRYR